MRPCFYPLLLGSCEHQSQASADGGTETTQQQQTDNTRRFSAGVHSVVVTDGDDGQMMKQAGIRSYIL